jgi:glycosyltransferase involved in cell wall biosynthesis
VIERFTDGLIFESAFAARVYKDRVSATDVPKRIIPNGLQPDDFIRPDPISDATDILFIGELRDIKGVDVLLEALSVLNKSRRVTATIVGAGPDEVELESLSAALGLDDVVNFTGALPARDAFKLGRIMVVPSRAESFPYIVLEAAAAGLPLIATSAGGIPEIVYGTDTALIEPGATQPLVDALNAVLDDPEAATARAKILRANVAEKFTVETMTNAVLGFYTLTSR